jgi:hypothetical protein
MRAPGGIIIRSPLRSIWRALFSSATSLATKRLRKKLVADHPSEKPLLPNHLVEYSKGFDENGYAISERAEKAKAAA